VSRLITEILRPGQINFQHTLLEWEEKSGKQGHDVRLVSDIRVRSKQAIRELGLDEKDTTNAELYFALHVRAKQDNEKLEEFFNIERTDSPEKLLKKIVKWVEKNHLPDTWVCKTSVMKSALKKCPPKALMKSLGLRSVDSMLKRNSTAELLPLALMMEPPQWKSKLRNEFKKYKPTDFDIRSVCLYLLEEERVEKLKQSGFHHSRIVTPCYEMGSIVLIAPKQRFHLDVLAITVSLLEAVAEIRRHSAYYRTISVRKDFGKQFQTVSSDGITKASQKLSHIGWNSLHRHLVGNDLLFSRLEQPYLVKEDIHAPAATAVLSSIDPNFEFWDGLDYVFFNKDNGQPVSLHIIDVVTNASNRFSFNEAVSSYGRARLWDELWSRYLAHDPTAEKVVSQFLGDEEI
jgi:hypothetical protein